MLKKAFLYSVWDKLSIPAGGDRTGRKNVSLVKTSFRILLPDNVISVCIVKSYKALENPRLSDLFFVLLLICKPLFLW